MTDRRHLLKLLMGGAASAWFPALAEAAAGPRRAKSCILLWMNGGPSQAHTFDLKPGREFKPIKTDVPGIEISEHLPLLAKQMKHVALLRGMSTGEAVHERGRYLMHTGYRQSGAASYPGLGCIASSELAVAEAALPGFVTIDGGVDGNDAGGSFRSVPAHLGPRHAPLAVSDPLKGVENLKPSVDASELADRTALLAKSDKRYLEARGGEAALAHRTTHLRAMRLLDSPQARAFDLDKEPAKSRAAYGDSKFGRACLMARRLVEAGVPFVEVTLGGWDDHGGAAKEVKRRSPYMDPAMATLLGDLSERGLLSSTLVVWMGEFGRSPHDNGIAHYPRAWTTLLAGAGVKGGRVIGRTSANGREVADRKVGAADLMATVMKALGIDWTKQHTTRDGRPIRLADRVGKPVHELF